jgi:tetratricopeptide (TPR) repeat protein
MGQPKQALAAYERAAERAPDDPHILSRKAAALQAAGRHDEAARLQQQVAQIERGAAAPEERQPDSGALSRPETLHLAGEQARQVGRIEAAVDAWLEESRAHSAAGHLDAALDACQQALTLASGSAKVHLEMIRLYFLRGWRDLAVERLLLLDRLLELAPESEVRAEVGRLATEHARRDPRLAPIAASSSALGRALDS